ncbi:uncharacterized protein VTP21DRAFT_9977 [Calcarisporiella thermophila]|uniref:uncharacterized protein n=1 Tax=Calcarisporiella thermophila TaxID=911321 RepID=UPI00374462D0
MFGLIVAGRLVQTNIQQVDANKFVFELSDAANINHIVVFLLGTIPFKPGFAATVHFQWPNKPWQLLGMISNEKPSAIFRLRGTSNAKSDVSGDMAMESSEPISATLGISVEPEEQVQAQIQAQQQSQAQPQTGALSVFQQSSLLGPKAGEVGVAVQKILQHLYDYITSYATSVLPPGTPVIGALNAGSYIPLKVFEEWYAVIGRKVRDPSFLTKE